jgi:hypothetical protein
MCGITWRDRSALAHLPSMEDGTARVALDDLLSIRSRGVPHFPYDDILTRNGRGSSARTAAMPVLVVPLVMRRWTSSLTITLTITAHEHSWEAHSRIARQERLSNALRPGGMRPDDVKYVAQRDAQVERLQRCKSPHRLLMTGKGCRDWNG